MILCYIDRRLQFIWHPHSAKVARDRSSLSRSGVPGPSVSELEGVVSAQGLEPRT